MNKETIDELLNEVFPEKLEEFIKEPEEKIVKFKEPVAEVQKSTLNIPKSNDYYNVFGMSISKSTIYLFIVFILLVVGYLLWSYFENKKKPKQQDL